MTEQKRKLEWGSESSEEFLVQVGVHQGSVLPPLFFAIAVDVISENAREGLINEIFYVDDLALMSEKYRQFKSEIFKMERGI